MKEPTPTLLLVDGHGLLWSATFGFPAEIKSQDKTRDLTGVFAFFAILRAAIRDNIPEEPPEIIVVFDGEHGSSKRKEVDSNYKNNRLQDEESLRPLKFLPDVKRGLELFDIPWVELENEEADDVISTIISKAPKNRDILIYSQDRDFYQLVNEQVKILNTRMKSGQKIISSKMIKDRYGVSPSQWCSFRALTGDSADNIPGIKGIGPKTAAKLLDGNLTLSELSESDRLMSGKFKRVQESWEQLMKWEEMITLNAKIEISISFQNKSSAELPPPAEVIQKLDLW